MRSLTALLLLLSFCSSQVLAAGPQIPQNDPIVEKLTLTFIAHRDEVGFERFVGLANNPKWASDTRAFVQLRSRYEDSEAVRKTISIGTDIGRNAGGVMGGRAGLALGAASDAIDTSVDIYDLAGNIADKYYMPNRKIHTYAETRQQVQAAVMTAKKNGSYDYIMKILAQRYGSAFDRGEAPPEIEKDYRNAKNMLSLLKAAKSEKEQADILAKNINLLQGTASTILGSMAEEKRIQERIDRNNQNYENRRLQLDTLNSQLSVASSLAGVFGIEELEKPLAIGQFYVDVSTAANVWDKAVHTEGATGAQIANADWAMAATTVGLVVVAYQAYTSAKKDAALQKALAQIMVQLAAISKKIDFLTKLTREGFENVIGRLDQQQFMMYTLLSRVNKVLDRQTQVDLNPYITRTNDIASRYNTWRTLCASSLKECKASEFYAQMNSFLLDNRSVDLRRFDIYSPENLSNLTVSLPSDGLKNYRQYQSSSYLIDNLKSIVREKLNSRTLNAQWAEFYRQADKFLNLDWALPNGKIWSDTISMVSHIQAKTGVKPPVALAEQLFRDGKKLKRYDDNFLSRKMTHAILLNELESEAQGLVSQVGQIHKILSNTFVTKFSPAGEVTQPASDLKFPQTDRLPNCMFGGPYRDRRSVGPNVEALKEFLTTNSKTADIGYFRVLESLGYGALTACVQWSDPSFLRPDEAFRRYGLKPLMKFSMYYQVSLHLRFQWSPKAANDPYTKDEKDLTVIKVRTYSYNHKWWTQNVLGIRTNLLKRGDVTTLDKEKSEHYRSIIPKIINEEVAAEISGSEVGSSESSQFTVRKPREDEKLAVLADNPDFVRGMIESFNRYRTRFYLYKAFVQQSVLADTSNARCKLALSEPVSLSPRDKESGFPIMPNIHPLSILDSLQTGQFFARKNAAANFIHKTLRTADNKYFACQTVDTSPYIIDGFAKLAKVAQTSFWCRKMNLGCPAQ